VRVTRRPAWCLAVSGAIVGRLLTLP
jgi:hypothetical protein